MATPSRNLEARAIRLQTVPVEIRTFSSTLRQRMKLTADDKANLDAIRRDRVGMDIRIAEIDESIAKLMEERGILSYHRALISNIRLAEKFEISQAQMSYYMSGKTTRAARQLGRMY